MMTAFMAVLTRELRAYFYSPLAYVFLSVYLLVSGLATWNVSRFFDTAIASLSPFFQFQPWLLAIFIPAIGMRLWSEDFRGKTADLYFTSQRPLWLIHLAKFTAGLSVVLLALIGTLPYWLIVNYLGSPDNNIIAFSYLALFLLGGVFMLITLVFSALTQQQVIAFVLSTVTAFASLTLGLPNVFGQFSGQIPDSLVAWLHNLSLLEAYFRVLRGVWTVADLLFVLMSGALLFSLALALLNARRRTGQAFATPWTTLTFTALILCLPIARQHVQTLTAPLRVDVTENHLNTLSPAARDLVKNLKEPIYLDLYYNEAVGRDYPQIRSHAERVKALLDAFVRSSGGKLKLRLVDPKPFSEAEDRAVTHGIDAISTEGIDPLYFGLSGTNLVDDTQTISYLNPELDSALEFDIASLIAKLDKPDLPRIAILSGLEAIGPQGGNQSAMRLLSTLDSGFQIDWLTGDSYAIADDVETLIIVAPKSLSDYTAYQIDQFLMRKGRVILLSDPAPLIGNAPDMPEALARLITSWGAEISTNILADMEIGLPVTTRGLSGERIEPQPLYPGPGPANFNANDFLVSGLQKKIYFGGTGWIKSLPDMPITSHSLISSGNAPAYLTPNALEGGDLSPAGIRKTAKPIGETVAIASRLSGRFTSLFPEGAPQPKLPDDPVLQRLAQAELIERPHLKDSAVQGEIILIADTDFLLDAFYVHPQTGQPIAGNEDFVLSLLDQFAGRPELAALRTRPVARRPMTRILEMRETAEKKYLTAQDTLEQEISKLQGQMSGQTDEIDPAVRAQYLNAREQLRDLQKSFRAQITGLESWLRALTIWFPVALSILAGFLVHFTGRRAS